MALDLIAAFAASAAAKLTATNKPFITWARKNPLKAFGLAVGALVGAAAIFFLSPFIIAGGALFLSAGLLIQVGVLLTLSGLFMFVITTLQVLYNFNWLVSDAEIDAQIKAGFDSLYGLLGATTGRAMATLVCGALPGVASLAINRGVAAAVFDAVADDAKDELVGQIASLANATFRAFMTAQIKKQFKSARRYLKKKPNHPISKILREKMGEKGFYEWGKKSGQSFTLANHVEERVEKIKDPRLRNFTEEFLEEFSEGCIEIGYVVTNTIESTLAAQALMQRRQQGIDPDEAVVTATVT